MKTILLILSCLSLFGCKTCYDCRRTWQIETYANINGSKHVTGRWTTFEDFETCDPDEVKQVEQGVPLSKWYWQGAWCDSVATCNCVKQ